MAQPYAEVSGSKRQGIPGLLDDLFSSVDEMEKVSARVANKLQPVVNQNVETPRNEMVLRPGTTPIITEKPFDGSPMTGSLMTLRRRVIDITERLDSLYNALEL